MSSSANAYAAARRSIAVTAQLIADEIILLSTGLRVVPQPRQGATATSRGEIAPMLDTIMQTLDERLGSRAAAQRWLLTPQPEFGRETPGELVERGAGDSVLAALHRPSAKRLSHAPE